MNYQNCLRAFLLVSFCAIIAAILIGCSINQQSSAALSANASKIANNYLKLAAESEGTTALRYQLQAAELLIQFSKIPDAQRILRTLPLNTENNPIVRRAILNSRLALLKNDLDRAQFLLKEIREKIIETPMPAINFNTHTYTERIALLLPTKGPFAKTAKIIQDGFLAAYYQQSKPNTRSLGITLKIYDLGSGNQVTKAYQQAIDESVNLIVGPLTKTEVQKIANLPLTIPVLALNQISQAQTSEKLYQFALRPEDEVSAIAALAYQKGQRRALVFYANNTLGHRLNQAFKEEWRNRGGLLLESRSFKSINDLEEKLKLLLQFKQKPRQDADLIFLAVNAEEGRHIKPLLKFFDAENLPVYGTATLYNGQPNSQQDKSLNGVYFCDMPWVLQHSHQLQETQQAIEKIWSSNTTGSPRFFAFGMDAYTLAQHLLKSHPWPTYGIHGLTGHLNINARQQIQRGLICAQFQKGIPVVYP